jgi:hypothetical protein
MGERRNVTRRTLLGGIAAAGAASLVRPAAGLAVALDPASGISSRWVGSLSGASPPLNAPLRFSLVGIEWSGPRRARIELSARAPNGSWSPWVPVSSTGHDADGPVTRSTLYGEPVWTGPADEVQLRTDTPVSGLRVHFVSPSSRPRAQTAAGFQRAAPVLDAGPGQPAILAREDWAQGQAPPSNFAGYATVKLGFVHHTVNPNGYSAADVPSLLLGIFQYHRYVRGYFDIAYNFLIDLYGRMWEGRAGGIDMPVVGAHAGGYNAESTGVAVLGDFTNVVPSPAAIHALEQLLAWKLSLHGTPTHGDVTVVVDPGSAYYTPFAPGAHVSLPRVAGHRDGDSTDCPGNAFYARLPSIRPRITSLAGSPAKATLDVPAAVAVAEEPVSVSGRLHLLGSPQPLSGAPVELQRLYSGARLTLATATTGPDGSWSAMVSPRFNILLRALHRPHPATVTDWVVIDVAPRITLEVSSVSPIHVSGTILPGKSHVTVELYRGATASGKPVASKQLVVSEGTFAGSIRRPKPGRYVVIARSADDAENVAGASQPVAVTVS